MLLRLQSVQAPCCHRLFSSRKHARWETHVGPPCPLVAQGSSQLAQRRVYLVLHHILKELASKRLAADQRNFEQAREGRRRGVAPQACWCQEIAEPRVAPASVPRPPAL